MLERYLIRGTSEVLAEEGEKITGEKANEIGQVECLFGYDKT